MSSAPVLIAGSGPVGGTLALALGLAGVPVAVLDRSPPPAVPAPEEPLDLRVSALSAGAVRLLDALGAWQRIGPERRTPYRGLEVWEDRARIHFHAADLGLPALGVLVENRALVAALGAALAELPCVERLAPGAVAALEAMPDAITATLEDGCVRRAALVVGAEGADSAVRRAAGIDAQLTDFRHSALVTHVRTAQPHDGIAYQRFLLGGPLALLPLPDGRVSVVWSCAPAQSEALAALPEDEFAVALGQASEWRLGEILTVDRRAVLPLRGLRAARYVGVRVALAGDAVHVVHPLAGLGATLGLLDAGTLAELLAEAVARGADPGGATLLRRYERARRSANLPVVAAVEALRRLYGVRSGPLPVLRRAGLALTARAGPLKTLLAAHASAQAGELPVLARPRAGHRLT